jgi:hypothetical protein
MPLRRQTPLSFTQEQKDFVETVFETSDVRRVRQARLSVRPFSSQAANDRDAFLKETFEQLSWLVEADGKAELNEKEQDITSSAASMITNILHFAADAGASPLEVLEKAISGYSDQLGSDAEYRLVGDFIEQLLDIAGNPRT